MNKNNNTTTTNTTTAVNTTSDIPKTPIPTMTHSTSSSTMLNNTPATTTQQHMPSTRTTSTCLEDAQHALMMKTYSLVGYDYLETLTNELLAMTQAQTVIIQQVITMDECNNITERLEQQGIKVNMACLDDASSVEHDGAPEEDLTHCLELLDQQQQRKHKRKHPHQQNQPLDNDQLHNNQLLLTRACSSTVSSVATSKYCVIPLALLHDTPPLKTLKEGVYITPNDQQPSFEVAKSATTATTKNDDDSRMTMMMDYCTESVADTFLPPHTSFVGIRLQGANALPLGLLTVCHDKVKTPHWFTETHQLLSFVATRTMRELAGIRDSERLVKARNDATQDAENKIKFLADMSHEIRTPMNAVIALTDLLLQEKSSLNDEQIEHLDVIQTSGHHLLTVINDILDISKINHDPKFKLENRRFSLRKCIKDALNMARHQASMSQLSKMVYVVEGPPDMDDNVPVQHTIASLERLGMLPPMTSQYKGKVLLPLIWNIDVDVPDYLMGDTMRLTQILLNLCSNAVKFTKKGGIRVSIKRYVPTPLQANTNQQSKLKQRYEAKLETIYTRTMQGNATKDGVGDGDGRAGAGASDNDDPTSNPEDDEPRLEKTILEICVSDSGIGIPSDRLPRLFKSFSQIDISTARRYGGTGLGLAISSTLVNRMGGGLWVESEEGVGSRFAMTLPMAIALGRTARTYGSESTTTSSFITSPPSPSSSVSDGSGSVNSGVFERTSDASSSSHSYTNVLSPATYSSNNSNTSGYFPNVSQQHQQHQQQVNSLQQRLRSQSSWSLANARHHHFHHQQLLNASSPPFESASPDHSTTHPLSALSSSPPNSNTNQHPPSVLTHYSSSDAISQTTRPSSSSDQRRPLLRRENAASQSNIHHHQQHFERGPTPGVATDTRSPTSPSPPRSGGRRLRAPSTNNTKSHYHHQQQQQQQQQQQHHHHHKKTTAEESFALTYPVKILLAEDNVLNQKIAVSILKRLGYHDVVVTNNGKEALEVMRKIKFDVIFMDLYMPEMDGLEATREIISTRTKDTTTTSKRPPLLNVNDVYIIALTASASNQDRQICIDAGMNDFISKPFTMMEMKAALKTCGTKRAKRRKQRKDDDDGDGDNHQQSGSDTVMQPQEVEVEVVDAMVGVENAL
ncbi:hypothetical protein BCR42DRAFT_31460 [Absidia repens]|uniref:Uncharacterized protein n=1 Tax=Absidia repens TaxID=90262 RepID=A0A1X2IJA6_9FUNG|nr:hypothetical protein BCR42DRAFT_31460 [Absidia repens]